MYQIYLLSVLTNVLAGLTLANGEFGEKLKLNTVFNVDLFSRTGFRLGLGIVTFIVGFLKLLSVSPGDVAVVGDLVPALAGLLMGFTLAFQYYQQRTEVRSNTVETLDRVFGRHAARLGIVGVAAALVHFLLHRVLFL